MQIINPLKIINNSRRKKGEEKNSNFFVPDIGFTVPFYRLNSLFCINTVHVYLQLTPAAHRSRPKPEI